MAVTGDVWKSLTLAQMFPELDPNNPGSMASTIRDKINESEKELQDTISALNNTLSKAAALFNQANALNSAVTAAQKDFEDLIHNAANTGLYARVLGLCPAGGKTANPFSKSFPGAMITSPAQFQSEIAKAMAAYQKTVPSKDPVKRKKGIKDKADLCAPEFVGDTAYIGGILIVVGAPNPKDLWEKIKLLGKIFSVFSQWGEDAYGNTKGDFGSDLEGFKEFWQFAKDQAAGMKLKGGPTLAKIKEKNAHSCDSWYCATLKDLIPAIDPDEEGSIANIALGIEQELVGRTSAVFDSIAAMGDRINSLVGIIRDLQNRISAMKRSLFDLMNNLAATGAYIHPIGADLSLHNNAEFTNACNQALLDMSDPQRPKFKGNSVLMAGLLIVVGAPNPSGMKDSLGNISKVIKGFGSKFEDMTQSASDITKQASEFGKSVSTTKTKAAVAAEAKAKAAADRKQNAATTAAAVVTQQQQQSTIIAAKYPIITSRTTHSLISLTEYRYQITATNSPTTYLAQGLPPGFILDSGTGLISGRTAVPEVYSIRVSAANSKGAGPTTTVTFTVLANLPALPQVQAPTTIQVTVNSPYLLEILAANNPEEFLISGSLPPGLTFQQV